MQISNLLKGRFSLLFSFSLWFITFSFFLRLGLLVWEYQEVNWNFFVILRTFVTGLFFDFGTLSFITLILSIYLAIFPNKWIGKWVDKIVLTFIVSLIVFILVFTFLAEITFWEEFRSRFNFIAVDYLIYTFEVIKNIEQSYPLPLLVSVVVIIAGISLWLFYKTKSFKNTFKYHANWQQRISLLVVNLLVVSLFAGFIYNNQAEWSTNRYNSELSKSGIYSFFAAFRNNQMKYEEFYTDLNLNKAFQIARTNLSEGNEKYREPNLSIHRSISINPASNQRPNVVLILVESLSASFLTQFGNEQQITPFLDSLSQNSVFFSNLYATGTRTVRGMEAVTLCIPPTPGQSIVKRPENTNLYTISNVFEAKKYQNNFFYGGDGYFDNMNAYFGGNGFNIYDRGRGSILSDKIKTHRFNITNKEVTFENAWGICDEDIYNKMLNISDELYQKKQPFFNFIMTTSNHRPYTYPDQKIDIPSGTGRAGAVKYTDYAIKELLEKAKKKPWFKNTVFVIMADHCASSAGKNEIDIANYHIPAWIINMPNVPNEKVSKLCSQIDVFPTIFSMLKWNYDSDFFGNDVTNANFKPRALMGTYRKLSLMDESHRVMILSDQKQQAFYQWNQATNNMYQLPMNQNFLDQTISWYQTADYLFSNKKLN